MTRGGIAEAPTPGGATVPVGRHSMVRIERTGPKRGMLRYLLPIGLVALSTCTARPQQTRAVPTECSPRDPETLWIHSVLEGWVRATRDFLEIDPFPVPKTVLFDSSCAWYLAFEPADAPGSVPADTPLRLAGQAVPVRMLEHDGAIPLPNGAQVPAEIIAVAMPHRGGEDAYLVLALPELWYRHRQASQDPYLSIRIPGVALHEMVHTRQLPDLRRRIDTLGGRFELPGRFDDDVVEERFEDSARYGAMFDAELDLLYEAVSEMDRGRKITLISQAVSIARRRRERFFVGDDEMYSELEGLFLNMEGIAEWVRFKHHQADPAWPNTDTDIIAFLRGQENSWSQDEGLALILLLEQMVPGWKRQVLSSDMPSPLAILTGAIVGSRE